MPKDNCAVIKHLGIDLNAYLQCLLSAKLINMGKRGLRQRTGLFQKNMHIIT